MAPRTQLSKFCRSIGHHRTPSPAFERLEPRLALTGAFPLTVVAATNDEVTIDDEVAVIKEFGEKPVIGDAGQIAFAAAIEGPSVNDKNNRIIAVGPHLAWQPVGSQGDPAPFFFDISIDGFGTAGFKAGTGNGVGVFNVLANDLQPVAQQYETAPGTNLQFKRGEFGTDPFSSVAVNGSGQVAFYARLDGEEAHTLNDFGLWLGAAGDLQTVAREGDPAPGVDGQNWGDPIFKEIKVGVSGAVPLINDAGQTAFVGAVGVENSGVSLARGIWFGKPGGMQLIVSADHVATDTENIEFSDFDEEILDINNDGQVLFLAGLNTFGFDGQPAATRDDDRGLWLVEDGGAQTLVVREGDNAPDTGLVFGSGTGAGFEFFKAVLGGNGNVAFQAKLRGTDVTKDNDDSIWLRNSEGQLRMLAREGAHAPGAPDSVIFDEFRELHVNAHGVVAFFADVTGPDVNSLKDQGIWATDATGALQLVAREDQLIEIAPGINRKPTFLGLAGSSGGQDGYHSALGDDNRLVFWAGLGITHGEAIVIAELAPSPSMIRGTKFEDANGDGRRQPDEPGIAEWPIGLYSNGRLVAAERTDEKGQYGFGITTPGTYYITEEAADGWIQTFSTLGFSGTVDLTQLQDLADIDFGNFQKMTIGGANFEDVNGNGQYDDDEPGLDGFLFEIDLLGDGEFPYKTETPSDEFGSFEFPEPLGPRDDLEEGNFRLRPQPREGWVTTHPASGVHEQKVKSGLVSFDDIFGHFNLFNISGTSYEDVDGDGFIDEGEPGRAGWTIELDLNSDGAVEATTVTDAKGNFEFVGVGPGNPAGDRSFILREVVPEGWSSTYTSGPGQIISGQDWGPFEFLNFQHVKLGGMTYADLNADGQRQAGDLPLAGWTIQLDLDSDGSVDREAITDGRGNYEFDDVPPGTHTIREVARGGWMQTFPAGPGTYVIRARSGQDVDQLHFANAALGGVITGAKFDDQNNNGQREASEPGLSGWTIFIDANGNDVFDETDGEQSAVTDGSGSYAFPVNEGAYLVREVQQDGWNRTTANPEAIVVDQSSQLFANVDFGNHRLDLAGDTNRDGKVGFADFLLLAANFGKEDAVWEDGDFDNDSRVAFSDFLLLAASFGKEHPLAAAIERPGPAMVNAIDSVFSKDV